MVIGRGTTHGYYPMSGRQTNLIRGSGRIRYVRGFIVVNSNEPVRETGSRNRPANAKCC
jgi:hypothetical protein